MKSQSRDDKTVVVLGGDRFTISQLKEQLSLTLVAERPAISRVLKILHDTDIPLTRAEIAEKAGKSTVQTSGVLKELLELEFVARMKLTKHVVMYALTEKGYRVAKQRFEAGAPSDHPVVTLAREDTLSSVIAKFFNDEWGKSPKSLEKVHEALQMYGLNYPRQSVAVALLRLVRSGKLLRVGSSNEGFRYTAGTAVRVVEREAE